jgi:tetratricopeptide (TPR) repeat protein
VIVKQNDLINEIEQDHRRQLRMEEPFSFNSLNVKENSGQSTTGLNGHFVYSLLLIDVLIRMKSVSNDRKELIAYCKAQGQIENQELNKFERKYSAEKAVWWYTRDSFLHQMLNRALRTQDIDLLYLFRVIIADIYEQLKCYQCRSTIQVYRGQLMSEEELNRLQQSKGEFISINSFFSTTKCKRTATKFLKHPLDSNNVNLQQVLFIIDADPNVVTSKPFADISSLSEYHGEDEILFMIGCLFRLKNIYRDTDRIWKIEMKLCSDKENDLKNLFDHMKKEYSIGGDGNVTLLSFADVLLGMGKYELAEKIYRRLNLELSSNDPSLPSVYWSLGMLNKEIGDYDNGIVWFNRALEFYKRKNLRGHVRIGELYNWLGEMYRLKDDNSKALRYFNDAVVLFEAAHDENHSSMGYVYNNMGIVYRKQKNYSVALDFYKKSLAIRCKHLPSNHPDIASSYNNLGNVYLDLQQYDLAMEYHKKALDIYIKSCSAQHPDIAMSYRNIGHIHEKKGQWKQAMDNYQNAAAIYRNSLASDHSDVIQIQEAIKRVSPRLK